MQATAINKEIEPRASSPQPKHRRLDRKNGKGLAKDMIGPIETQIFKELPLSQSVVMGDMVQGKGTLSPDNVLMAYLEIPNLAHDFARVFHFCTTFELMEFLAGQQNKLSHRMAEEHADNKVIQRALVGELEPKEDGRGVEPF